MSRVSRVPNVNASTCRPGAHGRLQEHHHRARVGLHRAGDVDQVDELARHQLGLAPGALDRHAAGAHRLAQRAPRVERGARAGTAACAASGGAARRARDARRRARGRGAARRARSGRSRGRAAARRPTRRPRPASSLSSLALLARILAVAHLAPQRVRLDGLGRSSFWFSSGSSTPRSIGRCCSSDARRALPEGREGGVEDLDVVAPRDDRAAQRPVDVVAVGEVDRGERRAARPACGPARPRARPRAGCART